MTVPGPTKSSKDKSAEQAKGHSRDPVRRSIPSGPQAPVLALQRAVGNQEVTRLLHPGSDGQERISQNVPTIVQEVLRSPGQPLDPDTRSFMESRFGYDFNQVRVHRDAGANESASRLNALSYTLGHHIVFGEGKYGPGTNSGCALLAHELAHVIQQSRGGAIPEINQNAAHERSAEQAAEDVAKGQHFVEVKGSTAVGIARQAPPTPEEMFQEIVNERAWTFSPGGAPKEDPKKVGKGVGPATGGMTAGSSVFARMAVIDHQGKLVEYAGGQHAQIRSKINKYKLIFGREHAEIHAIKSLKHQIGSLKLGNRKDVQGGMLRVVVDQEPCPACSKALLKFVTRYGLGLEVLLPVRGDARFKRQPEKSLNNPVKGRGAAQSVQRVDYQKIPHLTSKLERIQRLFLPAPPRAPKSGVPPIPPTQSKSSQKTSSKTSGISTSTRHAIKRDFTRSGTVVHTQLNPKDYIRQRHATIRGMGRISRPKLKGAGLAQVFPGAMGALQDRMIKHAVAEQMLSKWSVLEKFRKDNPKDWIIAVVSLKEWKNESEGLRGRGVHSVEFYHGPTRQEAEAQIKRNIPVPEGWNEVGPFEGWIEPTRSLDDLKNEVESLSFFAKIIKWLKKLW